MTTSTIDPPGAPPRPTTPAPVQSRVRTITELLGSVAPGTEPLDVDGLTADELGSAVVAVERARAHLDALQTRLLQRFDAEACAADDGSASTNAWLRQHAQMASATAGARVKAARLLRSLPLVAARFDAGQFSFEQAQSFCAVLTPRTEAAMSRDEPELVELALGLRVDDLRRELRHWAESVDTDGAEPDAGHRSRSFHLSQTFDGQWFGSLELAAADGALVAGAIDRMAEWLFHQETVAGRLDPSLARSPRQRRADALVELVRRGAATLEAEAAPSRRPRPSISLLITLEDLAAGRPAATTDGAVVGGAGLDRLRCECAVEPIGWSVAGVPLSHGRTRRFPTPAQRRAAIAQFGGCAFPGCDAPVAWADLHHIVAWSAEGGPTDQPNLVPLCAGTHHQLVHEGGWSMQRNADGTVTFLRPDSTVFDPTPGWN